MKALKNISCKENVLQEEDVSELTQSIKNIENTLNSIMDNGYVKNYISASIENDLSNGGFYGILPTLSGTILGTYSSGLYYYDNETKSIQKSELISVAEGSTGLGDLSSEIDDLYGLSSAPGRIFKLIEYQNGKYIASGYCHEKKTNTKIYSSDDGFHWTVNAIFETGSSETTQRMQNVVYCNQKYYYVSLSTLYSSEDLINWSQVLTFQYVTSTIISQGNKLAIIKGGGTVNREENETVYIYDTENGTSESKQFDDLSVGQRWFYTKDGENIIIAGWKDVSPQASHIFWTNDMFETLNKVDVTSCLTKTGSGIVVRGMIKYGDVYYACTYGGEIIMSLDLNNWTLFDVIDEVGDAPVEGFSINTNNFIQFVSRRKKINETYQPPYLFNFKILNDRLLKKIVELTNN